MEDLHTWVDFVEQALAFTVEPADVYGNGPHSAAESRGIYLQGEILVQGTHQAVLGQILQGGKSEHVSV